MQDLEGVFVVSVVFLKSCVLTFDSLFCSLDYLANGRSAFYDNEGGSGDVVVEQSSRNDAVNIGMARGRVSSEICRKLNANSAI